MKIRVMGNKRLAIGLWLGFLLACGGIIARTNFRTDMGAFLPRAAPLAQLVLTEQATGGAASHLILVALTGAPVPVLAALSEDLVVRLRQHAEFSDVLNGDAASFSDVQNFVWRNRYLLAPDVTPARFTAAGLHAALESDLSLLGSDMGPMLQQSLPADPTNEAMNLLPALNDTQGPLSENGVWFSADGARALLLVHTGAAGFDIDGQQRDLALIAGDFALARAGMPNAGAMRLLTSGPGVFAVHTRDTTQRDVKKLSIFATLGAVLLLVFAYRSPTVLLLGLAPVASGTLAAIAAVSLVFGFVHGITLGFGVTLIGESLDYAIYLFTQTQRGDSAQATLKRIWPTLRLGMLTSVAGFCAMLFSSFTGFAQLGLFSIAGLLTSAGVTRFVLPHLVPENFFAAGAEPVAIPLGAVIRHQHRLRWVLGAALAGSIIALALHPGRFWDGNLDNLSPIPASDQALDQTLRHDLGVPDTRYFAVFQAPSAQQALAASEALAGVLNPLVAAQKLAGFDVPSSVLPRDVTQAARRAALPDAATLAARFAQAQAGLPFRANTFAPFFQDVAAARTAPLLIRANLPPELALRLDTMLVPRANAWVVMAPLRGVTDPPAIARAIAASGIAGASLVDLNLESGALLGRFQHEATALAVTGSAAILFLLLLGLQSPKRVIAVAAPLAAAVLLTAALLTLDGRKISIFMVVGFLLIIAVGSNYCLFFERSEPHASARQRAIASIVLANLCTVCAYGVMALSSIPVLHDIGKTVALGTFLSLICAALLSREVQAA